MTLREILTKLGTFRDGEIIYATKNSEWEVDSPAMVVSGESPIAETISSLSYFLEVAIAEEVIKVWSEWRDGRVPSDNEMIEAVIFYVENDAYLNE